MELGRNQSRIGFILFGFVAILSLSTSNINMWKRPLGKTVSKAPKKINREDPVGKLITRDSAQFRDGSWKQCKSHDDSFGHDDPRCDIEFINDLDEVVILCWVSPTGDLFHHYPINDCSIRDGSVSNSHTEFTQVGHAFVCFKRTAKLPSHIRDISASNFICAYIPHRTAACHSLTLSLSSPQARVESDASHLRRSSRRLGAIKVELSCSAIEQEAVIDTSEKEYHKALICDFTVFYEPGVFEGISNLRETLQEDLAVVCQLLPTHVLCRLQRDTSFWLDRSISYGPQSSPTIATICTYHPKEGADWLRRVGMNTSKAGSVEIYSAEHYLEARVLWGVGGLLLHELVHCIHDKYCAGGYDNVAIQRAYTAAMERGLYDQVIVHGPQGQGGRLAKAYACANCMEFFAELSVAFLWNIDHSTEFNKWFPFNRQLLQQHDPDTCRALQEIWDEVDDCCKD